MKLTAQKLSKYGVFSGSYFDAFGLNRRDTKYLFVFSPNAEKYRPEKFPYLDTFHTAASKTDVISLSKNCDLDYYKTHLYISLLLQKLILKTVFIKTTTHKNMHEIVINPKMLRQN